MRQRLTRPIRIVTGTLLALGILGPPAIAGGPYGHRHHIGVPIPPTARVVRPVPTSVPIPTSSRSPYLGTFRPEPILIATTGYGAGGGYAPAGKPSQPAAMSFHGPFSRLRSIPAEVVLYSRGYDGRVRPTGSGVVYSYTDPRLYPDVTLEPTGLELYPRRGVTPRPTMERYMIGQY